MAFKDPKKAREYQRKWRLANIEKVRKKHAEYMREYRATNGEHVREIDRERYKANPAKKNTQGTAYRNRNLDKVRAKNREYNTGLRENDHAKVRETARVWRLENLDKDRVYKANYAKNNPSKLLVNAAKRRAVKLQAIPAWYEKDAIENLYLRSSADTHVDHVIPLVNDQVCGLHCLANLELISAFENRTKSNKFDQDLESAKQHKLSKLTSR